MIEVIGAVSIGIGGLMVMIVCDYHKDKDREHQKRERNLLERMTQLENDTEKLEKEKMAVNLAWLQLRLAELEARIGSNSQAAATE